MDLNHRPLPCQGSALPAELRDHFCCLIILHESFQKVKPFLKSCFRSEVKVISFDIKFIVADGHIVFHRNNILRY